jgi:hypothetical protein
MVVVCIRSEGIIEFDIIHFVGEGGRNLWPTFYLGSYG